MRLNNILLIIATICISCNSSKKEYTYYDNGQIFTEKEIKNGQICGICKTYYRDGRMLFEAKINNRKGKGISYYQNGKKMTEGDYIVTKHLGEPSLYEVGEHISYYETGEIKNKTIFDGKNKNGPFMQYYENGSVMITGYFRSSLQDSIWKYYTPKGKLEKEGIYKNGELLSERTP
jgi:uncharacterized protein